MRGEIMKSDPSPSSSQRNRVKVGKEIDDLVQIQSDCLTKCPKNNINGHRAIQPTGHHDIVNQSSRLIQTQSRELFILLKHLQSATSNAQLN